MRCPLCQSEMRQWITKKQKVFWLCSKYPQCDICMGEKSLEVLYDTQADVRRLEQANAEAQSRALAASQAYRRLKRDKRHGKVGVVPLPLRLGEYVGDVAKVAIARSKKKQERTSEQSAMAGGLAQVCEQGSGAHGAVRHSGG